MLDTEGGCSRDMKLWRHLKENSDDVIEARTVLGCSRFSVLGCTSACLFCIGYLKYLITDCCEKTVQMCPEFSMEYLQYAKTEV